jgi:hypothetical protein
MTTPDRSYVLYNDLPQRGYRQIKARSQESPYSLVFFVEIREGTVLQVHPSDTENTDVKFINCATMSEAIAKAEEEHESSLLSGWHDYDDSV